MTDRVGGRLTKLHCLYCVGQLGGGVGGWGAAPERLVAVRCWPRFPPAFSSIPGSSSKRGRSPTQLSACRCASIGKYVSGKALWSAVERVLLG